MSDACSSYILAGACTALICTTLVKFSKGNKLDHIPTAGSSTLLGSYLAGIKFTIDGFRTIQDGYKKHKPGAFKVATPTSWLVILSRGQLEDVMKLREDELSSREASEDTIQSEYILGPEIRRDRYHLPIIRTQLTRNLARLYPHIRDEIIVAFSETLDLKGNEWKSVPAYATMQRIICRTSHRILVGRPLCGDPAWIDLNTTFSDSIFKEIILLKIIPRFLLPIVAGWVTNMAQRTESAAKYLGPLIAKRQEHMYSNDENDKPVDFLQWAMDEGNETSVEKLTRRIIALNLALLHTSTTTFVQALYHLAENPAYSRLLREEVTAVVRTDGWTKDAISKMVRIDSFLKETQRLDGFSVVPIKRKTMKNITLSDGTFIPKGTYVAVPSHAIHNDSELYENPDTFDPFRFVELRSKDEDNTRYQMVSVNPESLGFGLGTPACPGRFFAVTLLKSMLAHVVVSYDVKLEDNAPPPRNQYISTAILANSTARVVFRKRVD